MKAEFTVIIEPNKDNGVVARIAEVPGIVVKAANAKVARQQIAIRLQHHFERQRKAALKRAGPASRMGKIAIHVFPKARRKQRKSKKTSNDPLFGPLFEELIRQGRMTREGLEAALAREDGDFVPIKLPGKPLSEEIIEDRR